MEIQMFESIRNNPRLQNFKITPKQRIGLFVGVALVISFVAWLITGSSNRNDVSAPPGTVSQSPATSLTEIPAVIVSKEDLLSATKDVGFPVYWNGEMKDTKIELTVLSEGKVYVRYLPNDVAVGAGEPYFTVASYYDPEAFGKVQSLGSTTGSKFIRYSGGAIAASASEEEQNIYFAFDLNPVLYNIYSPDPKVGWDGLDSGSIVLLQ